MQTWICVKQDNLNTYIHIGFLGIVLNFGPIPLAVNMNIF